MPERQTLNRRQVSAPVIQKHEAPAGMGISHGPSVLQRARRDPGSLSHGDIMQLQRSLGNRAVIQLLSDMRSAPTDEGQLPAQRKENNTGIPDRLKSGVENLSGMSMDDVRVHYNSAKPEEMAAHAFTQGNNIHVAPGQERHLPHEAWHVVQQRQGRVQPTIQAKGGVPVNDDASLEQEADVMGQRALKTTAPNGDRVQAAGGGSPDVIQKKGFSADEIINALMGISFINKKLNEKLIHRHDSGDLVAKYKLIHHVRKVVDQYKAHFEGGETDMAVRQGMVISIVVDNVAKLVAMNVLNDPELAPEIAGKLMEVFSKDIEKQFKNMDKMKESVAFAQNFVRDDPITMLLHEEITEEEAVVKIKQHAKDLKKTPLEVFNLYKQKFEIEITTRKRERIEKKEDKGQASSDSGAYSIAQAPGELSKSYFDKLFGGAAQAPKWKDDGSGLEYSDKTKAILENLKKIIETDAKPDVPEYQQIKGLTDKQSKHLAIVKDQEAKAQAEVTPEGSVDERVAIRLNSIFNLNSMDKARWVRDQIKNNIEKLPLTITVKGVEWFGKKVPEGKDTLYRTGASRRNTMKYSKLFNKFWTSGEFKYLGEYKGTDNRTKNYNRFRRWKDNQESNRVGLSDAELPSFGALNMNWNMHGSDSKMKEQYGKNYYGDAHFVVKKDNVKDRLVYTATDYGTPRRTAYAAFCDFLLKRGGIVEGKHKDAAADDIAQTMVNSILNLNFNLFKQQQNFEVQIFGSLDVAVDVKELYMAPATPPKAKQNAKKFCDKNGIEFKITEPPKDLVVLSCLQDPKKSIKERIDQMFAADHH